MRYRLFCLFSGLLLAWSAVAATASPDFRALAQDIQKRLDHAAELYAKQNAAEARAQVQGAYFEVFENLEGPIRRGRRSRGSCRAQRVFTCARAWSLR